jgi:hypothetical protein
MEEKKIILISGIQACLLMIAAGAVQAQQIQTTGTPGSPSATTTISGKQLPPPDLEFGGVIKEKATESKPWWPPTVVPPKNAPNILLIMTDDCGFGAPGTFGGVVPTGPRSDRQGGSSLHPVSFDVALLADARRADHGS